MSTSATLGIPPRTGHVRVLVDGTPVEVKAGSSALDAVRAAGLDIPTACSDPRLKPSGGCRLCLVKLKGHNRPVTSCALSITEGMELEVDTPDLVLARRGAMQMLAKDYPGEYVDQYPEKSFHQWLGKYGLKPAPSIAKPAPDDSNPYFTFDPAACIKCFKCVRICDELQGSFVWTILDRSTETRVAPDSLTTMMESSCKSCGACVDACPTAALADKQRADPKQTATWTRTTCPYCGVGCELNVAAQDGKIVQVLPVLDSPVSKGHLCVKGRYAHQYVHAPDRLTTPLIRDGDRFREATWDEAMGCVAERFGTILNEHGPDSIGVLGSARAPNEDNYLAQKFARVVIGTNNVDCCARVCHGPTAAAMKAMIGTGAATNSYDDLAWAKTILVIGCNPLENHPVVGDRIRQAVLKGAKLIVVDPRRIELADLADVFVQLRPGGNVPFLHGMAHVMLNEGLCADEFLSERVAEVEEFREFVAGWTPEKAGKECGVDPEVIRQAARLYATNGPAMSFHGLGMTEHYQGTEGIMCLVNVALLAGNIGRRGAGVNPLRGQNNVQGSAHMGCEPSNLTGFVSIPDGKEKFAKVWGVPVPETKGLRMTEMLEGALDGKVKALWAIGYDILFSNASASLTRKQLGAMDFVVVQDLFLTETAKEFADVVLPASSSFERGGTFMNAERRVQRVRAAIPPVGDSKPDWEIVQMVAKAMGRDQGFSFASEEEIWEEVRQVWAPGAGISYERLEGGGIQWPCTSLDHPGTEVLHRESFSNGKTAALKRVEYLPTPEVTCEEFPLVMNSGRTLYQFNAGTMSGRTKNNVLRPTDTLDIHPEDALALGLVDGEKARVVSRYGSAVLPARVSRALRRGEVFTTFHDREVFLNLVTSQVQDRIVGAPEFKVTAVRVERVDGQTLRDADSCPLPNASVKP